MKIDTLLDLYFKKKEMISTFQYSNPIQYTKKNPFLFLLEEIDVCELSQFCQFLTVLQISK